MAAYRSLRNVLAAALSVPSAAGSLDALLQLDLSQELERLRAKTGVEMPGNPAGHGFKVYSQADEDGILQSIFHRLAIEQGSFVEIGCGNGLENNTHYLLLKGWRGVWVDGDSANMAAIRAALPQNSQLRLIESFVDRDNAPALLDDAARQMLGELDLLSVDIDGNDLDVTVACVKAWQPKVIVVEYNAKFPPPMVVSVSYDAGHRWKGDDYHGASLSALAGALEPYRLVSCNLAGTNAFFVKQHLSAGFGSYEVEKLYQPARFHLTALRSGHPPSLAFLASSLAHSARC